MSNVQSIMRWSLVAGLLGAAACESLNVADPNDPDRKRVLSDAASTTTLAAGALQTWLNVTMAMDPDGALTTTKTGTHRGHMLPLPQTKTPISGGLRRSAPSRIASVSCSKYRRCPVPAYGRGLCRLGARRDTHEYRSLRGAAGDSERNHGAGLAGHSV